MKRLKVAFAFLILVMLSVMGTMIYKNVGVIVREEVEHELIKPGAEFSIKASHFVEMQGEEKVLEVDATEAYYFKESVTVGLKEPRAIFYRKDGKEIYLKGRRGKLNTESNDLEVEEDVTIDTPGGYHLETTVVNYNSRDRLVHTDEEVRITGRRMKVKGEGMIIRVDEEKLHLARNVEAIIFE